MPTIHLVIKGKVQGVFFRATAKDVAKALDLKGWVKNTPEGDVEVLATGDEDAIRQFIEWSKRGPDKALVSSVAVTSLNEKPFNDFRIIRG
ncbi:acylphosphatase [Flavisolibacter ginsenosidimutans]|uniref:Acylphosphatase n=1 Tax=Flavisolibacter ginsenosidimutans TaxID=661481 RepID=A0A5B8UNP0_9BACT|nr:acylphosphatase [Flavisolibacter ginsenosidimutans]QEC58291.1 acylphosphatase [Flavisolibacter ginsenosidimutans]